MNDKNEPLESLIGAVSFGVLLIWIGISLWIKTVALGLIGSGIIILISEFTHKHYCKKIDGSWIFVGGLLVVAGIGKSQIELPIVPIALIASGILLLYSKLIKKQ